LLEIKSLCRFRKELKDKASDAKIQLKTYVDQLFPELNVFFIFLTRTTIYCGQLPHSSTNGKK
ncbi:MAG: hypothetical protein II663_03840, partial [Bacteroidales bacterium]|nr:hypothetical protein [Bacteroidales bacterium]